MKKSEAQNFMIFIFSQKDDYVCDGDFYAMGEFSHSKLIFKHCCKMYHTSAHEF